MARDEKESLVPSTKTLVSPENYQKLEPMLKKMSAEERRRFNREFEEFGRSVLNMGMARLEVGRHLLNLRELLDKQGKRYFVKMLKTVLPKSVSTAYRCMEDFERVNRLLPDYAMPAIVARINRRDEVEMLDRIVKRLPPPGKTSQELLPAWMDRVNEEIAKSKKRTKEREEGVVLPPDARKDQVDMFLKETFRYVVSRLAKLPDNRSRANFIKRLAGYALNEIGVTGPQTVNALSIPDGYRAVRGRPPKEDGVEDGPEGERRGAIGFPAPLPSRGVQIVH